MAARLSIRHLFTALFLTSLLLAVTVSSSSGADEKEYTLRVLHTNDHHSHIEPVNAGDREVGGVARRKTAIDRARSAGGNVLLLDAGDVFQGTLYFNQFAGQADLYFYNQMKYDAMTLGNHEFDRGQKTLADFIAGTTFPVVSANVEAEPGSPLAGKVKPWTVKEMGGQKIGIIGLTTENTGILGNPGPGVSFGSPAAAARRRVEELSALGANKIVAVTHLGFEEDRQLARQVAGIDVIVGGHSHTLLGELPAAVGSYPMVETGPGGTRVLIVQDGEWGKNLGDLTVAFDSTGRVTSWEGKPLPIDESIAPDPSFLAKQKEFAEPLTTFRSTLVGQSAVELEGAREKVRGEETNLGNLVADAMLESTRRQGARIALINSGGIRTGIPAGDVSLGQLLEVLPFGNILVRLDITGLQLREALENGVSRAEYLEGRFPQLSGLRFLWNPSAPAGSRVLAIEIADGDGFKPVDPAATYRVATNDFMAAGGDGYDVLKAGSEKYDTNFLLADVVADYLRDRSPIDPRVEGRILRGSAGAGKAVIPAALPNTGEQSADPVEAGVLVLLVALGSIAISKGLDLRKR